jgi:hypothetical protein
MTITRAVMVKSVKPVMASKTGPKRYSITTGKPIIRYMANTRMSNARDVIREIYSRKNLALNVIPAIVRMTSIKVRRVKNAGVATMKLTGDKRWYLIMT